jgi:Immunity protein family (Imm11)
VASYSILREAIDDRYCGVYDYLDEFPDIENPAEGIPTADTFPDDVRFQMARETPGLLVADVINNAFGYLMVSAKGRAFLEKHVQGAKVEWLRFTLLNHKARVASTECWIANVLGTVDCVDTRRTTGEMSQVDPGEYMNITRLVLDPQRIPPNANLFRIASLPTVMIVRDDLRAAMEAEPLTGVEFLELDTDVDLS